MLDFERGGQLSCLYCNTVLRFEGQDRLYSPILVVLVSMVPEEVAPPVVYTAQEVARTTEYVGHVGERSG